MLKTSKFNTSMRSNSMKRHCKSLLPSSSQNFEPCKPDNAILQYLNQHVRQLGLDAPSFTNQKDKSNNSDKSERHKSSSSNKRKHRTDRSDKKRKRTDVSDSNRNLPIINRNLVDHPTTKKRDRYPVVGPLVGPLVDPWWAPWCSSIHYPLV